MTQKIFLITGATGQTGRHTTTLLLARGHQVRALVHHEDARSEALKEQGAAIVVGDMLNFSDVRAALQGTNGAYFVYPLAPGLVQATAIFAQAACEAHVDTLVNLSQVAAHPHAISNASFNHWIAERVFDWSGLGVTHVRPTIFAEWLLYTAPSMATSNVLRIPFRDNKVALIATEDVAHVVAAILIEPEFHRGHTYPLFGAVEQAFPEIVAEMSQALGKDIRYELVDAGTFLQLMPQSTNQDAAFQGYAFQHFTAISQMFPNGTFAGINDVVREVGQRNPTTVYEFITQNAVAFATNTYEKP